VGGTQVRTVAARLSGAPSAGGLSFVADPSAGFPRTTTTLVDAVIASDGEAVYFAGCSEEAAALIRLLRIAGFTGKFIGDQGVRDAGFIQGRR
jgi:ABC-type branched-subunit amino acid transport system substrate-binding protein